MANRRLLADMLKERVSSARIFPAIFEDIVEENKKRQANHQWQGKIYPSAGLSLGMCPVKFFETQKKPKFFKEKTLIQMEIGKALHKMFADRSAVIPNLLHEAPHLTDRRLLEKWRRNSPSTYMFLEPFSGEIDITVDDCGTPSVSDFKVQFTIPGEVSINDVETLLESIEENLSYYSAAEVIEALRTMISGKTDAWETDCQKIKSDYQMQLDIYAYMANTLGIYRRRVERNRLLLFNVCLAGEVKGYRELVWEFTKEREEEIRGWHEHLMPYWDAARSDSSIPCRSTYCRTHRKSNSESGC